MDDWKQLKSSVVHLDNDSSSLFNSLRSHGKSVVDMLRFPPTGQKEDLLPLATLLEKPVIEIEDYQKSLQAEVGASMVRNSLKPLVNCNDRFISTGLPTIDKQLGGGIPLGEITEVFGASGCGKSQFLFQLSLESQIVQPGNTQNQCIYISTESFLETKRLDDMHNSFIDRGSNTTLDDISYVYCQDLESQDHILFTQLPIKLENSSNKVRLVIIDSIAQNLRRENAISNSTYLREKICAQEVQINNTKDFTDVKLVHEQQLKKVHKSPKYSDRASKYHYLYLLHRHLVELAKKFNLAIVLINQISDYPSNSRDPEESKDPLNLDFQVGIHSGWDMKSVYRAFEENSVNSVYLNTGEHAIIEQQLQLSLNKRSKFDIDKTNKATQGEDYKNQKSLLTKLHQLSNTETKFQVPTLGYPWSKRISNRILLTKFYRPNIRDQKDVGQTDPETGLTYDQLCEGFDVNFFERGTSDIGSKRKFQDEVRIESIIEGWNVERYARVVSSSKNTSNAPNPKVEFTIQQDGITEAITYR
jgi:DNA repair protein RAD57